jgi:hypothetical protein
LAPATAHADEPNDGVPFAQALSDAQKVASMHKGWNVFLARGQSMIPQFTSASILVAATAKFEALKPGMLVVYRDASGDVVAHRLVELTDSGWIVKGLNNDKADPGLVTAKNLQGVVCGILNFKEGTDNLAALAANDKPTIAYAKKY